MISLLYALVVIYKEGWRTEAIKFDASQTQSTLLDGNYSLFSTVSAAAAASSFFSLPPRYQ